MSTLRVRWLRPWGPDEFAVEGALFSTELPASDADALLCEWAPYPEILDSPGPRAWYNAEPRSHPRMGPRSNAEHRPYLDRLAAGEMFHHAHEDLRFRVPHVTHPVGWSFAPEPSGGRRGEVVAVVSNFGGPPRNRWPDVERRNQFITHPAVRLYGKAAKWRRYRRGAWRLPRRPRNFVGPMEGSYDEKLAHMAGFDVCVCMENTAEAGYFTEKFIDAVRAGCVPIYQAHPSVAQSVLNGARWVDPAHFGFDPDETIRQALSLPQRDVAEQNRNWLASGGASATRRDRVYEKIAQALRVQTDLDRSRHRHER